jgi:hypothetical protein
MKSRAVSFIKIIENMILVFEKNGNFSMLKREVDSNCLIEIHKIRLSELIVSCDIEHSDDQKEIILYLTGNFGSIYRFSLGKDISRKESNIKNWNLCEKSSEFDSTLEFFIDDNDDALSFATENYKDSYIIDYLL